MEAPMKAVVLTTAIALVLAATAVLGAESVSLVGTWVGQRDRITQVEDAATVLRRWSSPSSRAGPFPAT